ncbi:MAG TPA: thioredoxin domain-containing protein [Candidatus Paceibacterota bacterium]|nr:thioredoxin domain-containing protein [Candidatus Paceibacterota bacterium]
MSKESIIITTIGVIFLIVMGVLIVKNSSSAPVTTVSGDQQTLLLGVNSHMTGSSSAKVTMVEFGDYQCPACGAAYPTIKNVTDFYQNNPNFNFIFRNFPLPQHQYAKISAEAAEAAGAQGKYWQMHDLLYENQSAWDPSVTQDPLAVFVTYAEQLGLDVNKFKTDVQNNAHVDRINADLADVQKLGLDHTPTVYINGEEVDKNLTVAALKAKIDSLLAK